MSTDGQQDDELEEAYEDAAARCNAELDEVLADAFEDEEPTADWDEWFDEVAGD